MKGVFLRKTIGNTRNITAIMSMERRGDNRRRSVSGSYTYFGQYPAQNERSGVHGIPQRKKRIADIQKYGNLKFAYRNREFWCKGYYVDTVWKNTKAIKEYIADQLKRDQESDQLAMFDPRDPFMGSK